jgi:hypothetical protein
LLVVIVVKVELWSAKTGKITELARMHISRVRTGEHGHNDYETQVLRKPLFKSVTRSTFVNGHRSLVEPVWTLIASALGGMGYMGVYSRLKAKKDDPICPTCKRNTHAELFDGCRFAKCPKGYTHDYQAPAIPASGSEDADSEGVGD